MSKIVFVVSGETLVQPEHIPPVTGDKITEPHVGDLVGQDVGDDLFEVVSSVLLIVHEVSFPEK